MQHYYRAGQSFLRGKLACGRSQPGKRTCRLESQGGGLPETVETFQTTGRGPNGDNTVLQGAVLLQLEQDRHGGIRLQQLGQGR